MAFESEEIRKRQHRRRQDAHRRKEQQKLLRRRLKIGLICAAAIIVLCAILIIFLRNDASTPGPDSTVSTTAPVQTHPTAQETVINIAIGGDLNVTDQVIAAGAFGDSYDYTAVFKDIVPLFASADASIINFEGNLCGKPYGTQYTSAPPELMTALASAGVDMIQMANSCSINNGLLGLQETLSGIRNAGMEPLGAYGSDEEFENSRGFTLRSINGVKVAFVAFTKGMDGLSLPEGSENYVNLLYTDYTSTYQDVNEAGIKNILRNIALEKPDVTVALLHWGSEYNNQVSDSQTRIIKLMQNEGVDAIVGTHSHYVQKLEFDKEKGTVVAYSLGDLLGNGEKTNTDSSIILQLEVTKNNTTGESKISAVTYTPVYIATAEKDETERIQLIRIPEAITAYEANSIHKVSSETYTAMKNAFSRIRSRTGL